MDVIRLILRNLDHLRRPVLIASAAAAVDGIATFAFPAALSEFTNGDLSPDRLRMLLIVLGGSVAVSTAAQWVVRAVGESAAQQFSDHLRLKYFDAFTRVPYASLTKRHSGYTLSLINSVASNAPRLISTFYWNIVRGLVEFSLFLAYTARDSLSIAGLNLVLMLFLVLIAARSAIRTQVPEDRQNLAQAALMERFVDFLSNAVTIRRLRVERFAERVLTRASAAVTPTVARAQRAKANHWALVHGVLFATEIATICFFVVRIVEGKNEPSMLVVFIAVYWLIKRQVESLSGDAVVLNIIRTQMRRLEELDVAPPDGSDGEATPWERYELRGARFRYPSGGPVIHIPSFHLARNERVWITGPSGEGKTTFLHILAGFLVPQAGAQRVDGSPDRGRPFFRGQALIVAQDIELFDLSVRDNLTLGRGVSDRSLLAVLEELDLDSWVAQLPHGLGTVVGEHGATLSAGQKQRLSLARAILQDRETYFFDEPTSHLDAATEARVFAFLRKRLAGKSAVIVSHRRLPADLYGRRYVMRKNELLPDPR